MIVNKVYKQQINPGRWRWERNQLEPQFIPCNLPPEALQGEVWASGVQCPAPGLQSAPNRRGKVKLWLQLMKFTSRSKLRDFGSAHHPAAFWQLLQFS